MSRKTVVVDKEFPAVTGLEFAVSIVAAADCVRTLQLTGACDSGGAEEEPTARA